MTKIGLLSDTHGYVDPKIYDYFKDVDEIWHAGDIGDISVIDELRKFKPLRGVYGNIDDHIIRSEMPEFNRFNLEIQQVLKSIPHDFLHWDETSYPVDLPECLIHNKYHVDSSLESNKNTFGPKSHKLIAYTILKRNI